MSEFIFTAKSERVGVIGCAQLARLEIGNRKFCWRNNGYSSVFLKYSLTVLLILLLTSFS